MSAPGDQVAENAAALFAARGSGRALARLPHPVGSDADAYAIQAETLRLMGARPGGWKAGLLPGGGIFAPLPAPGIQLSPASLPGPAVIEAEIAVRLARDLPARATPYTRGELLEAIAAAFVGVEIIQARLPADAPPRDILADFLASGGFVAGPDAPGWRSLDLAHLPVRLEIGGTIVAEHIGGHPSGDPLAPLVWLANALPELWSGGHLRAGDIVTTGSCTGVATALPGQAASAAFAGLGAVQLRFG